MEFWEAVRRRREALVAFNKSFQVPQRDAFLDRQRRAREDHLAWVKLHQAQRDGKCPFEPDELEVLLQEKEAGQVGPDVLDPVLAVGSEGDQK